VGCSRKFAYKNLKGRDFGYALAINSCEGDDSVDACTVTTLDATTAFAVPNPGCSSQSPPVFSGLAACRVASACRSLSLLRTGNFLFSPTLSTVDEEKVTWRVQMSTPAIGAVELISRWISGWLIQCEV
jgi:hypothetical protein